MDITAETIEKVLEISKPEMHDVEDVYGVLTAFSTKPLHQVKADPFANPGAVKVSTLSGFSGLVQAKLENKDFPAEFLIHIQDEHTVSLKTKVSDDYGRRLVLVEAQPVPFSQFRFGQWMNQEEFTIALASLFADTPDKAYVLNMAASLTNDATSNSEDDGFTQRATIKAGLRLKSETTIKPRVALAPYRTFPEIPQPVSEFVFRARCNGESGPMLMLVEADGGRWKIDAMAEISKAMETFDLQIPIIA